VKRIKLALLVTVLSSLLVAGSLGLSTYLNSMTFKYNIGPVGSMSAPLTIDMNADNGFIAVNSSGGSNGTGGIGSPVDMHDDLVLNVRANVTFSFHNVTDLQPFTTFQCLILLYNGTNAYTEALINQNIPTDSISVLPGTFDLWIAYTYTAGLTNATGTITLDVSAFSA
jgi:hypothetical protein